MDGLKTANIDKPIFVLGLARSGTSLIAGALKTCGAWLGRTVPGTGPENPRGFFEHVVLREHINKSILLNLNCDISGVRKLPALNNLPDIPNLAEVIKKIIRAEGYEENRRWLFKDAKLILLWPLFKKAFPNAQWIIVRRNEEDIIQSCLRTFFMVQHSKEHAFWKKWVDEYLLRLEKLKESDVWWREIWPHDLVQGDLSVLSHIVQDLGLQWNEPEVKHFISPAHWHAE